jgi:Phage P22-like portal protein
LSDASIIGECREFMRDNEDATTEIRQRAFEDLRFSVGEQWPPELQTQRQLESRPCMVVNWTDSLVRQVTNAMRQQRPRIKVHPVNNGADEKIADVIQGLTRHIEVNSFADTAYDIAGDFAVRIGFGYFRIVPKYVREDSFDQDLHIEPLRNPFAVRFDHNARLPDGSDAEYCAITERMSRAHFEAHYPDVEPVDFNETTIEDSRESWVEKDSVRLAEFYKIERDRDTLLMLSNGQTRWKSEVDLEILSSLGMQIVGDRESYRKVLCWYKLGGDAVIDKRKIKARYIPVIPVYGYRIDVGGRLVVKGMVRDLKDPQMSYNWFRTNSTEVVAGQPRSPYIMAEGQDEGFEDEWTAANRKNYSRLKYKPLWTVGPDGQAALLPPPQRQPPPQLSPGFVQMQQDAATDMRLVSGIFDATMGNQGDERSGKAIAERQRQSEVSNYAFYDNLTSSIRHCGRVILDLIPVYYDTERTVRIVGVDGKPNMVKLNEKVQDEKGAIQRVLNDVTVGTYDVVMDVGPGYDTKREEAAEQMVDLLRVMPQAAQMGADILVRNLDWPGAEQLADRLAAANPLAQQDEQFGDDVPEHAKAMIMHLQMQVQQQQQQLVALGMDKKYRLSAEHMRQENENKREILRQHAEDGREVLRAQAEMHREQIEDAGWTREVAEREAGANYRERLKGAIKLISEHLGREHESVMERTAERQAKE